MNIDRALCTVCNNLYKKIDIRDKVKDGLRVWLWVTRSYDGKMHNEHHGWVLVRATVKWNQDKMKWEIIPDKKDIEEQSKPKGKEQLNQDIDGLYYNDMINPFNRIYSKL